MQVLIIWWNFNKLWTLFNYIWFRVKY